MNQIGKYKVVKELGAGGFGAVYLCEDPRLGVEVAIKVFKVKDENLAGHATSASTDAAGVLKQRFMAEAKTLHKLGANPYIVNIKDYDEMEDGTPYYIMPYLPNSLENEIGKDAFSKGKLEETPKHLHPRRLASTKAIEVLKQVLEGLSAVHQAGLVHRDIKPANILFDEQHNVQLCDFGIAKTPDAEFSQSGVGMGSRNYMSPEQRESAKHVDTQSDVYSVGVLAYRMFTGTLPSGRFKDPIEYAPEIGQALNDLILSAMELHESERPKDAHDFLVQFKRALNSMSESDIDDSDHTGTVINDTSTVQIKAELKPLQSKITQLLEKQGEIKEGDKGVLMALADLADVDEAGLNALIEQVKADLVTTNPEQKAFQQWVSTVARKAQANELLSDDEQQSFIEAGSHTTGKTESELSGIFTEKFKNVKKAAPVKEEAKPDPVLSSLQQSSSADEDEAPGNKSKVAIAVAIAVLALGGVGYFVLSPSESSKPVAQQTQKNNRFNLEVVSIPSDATINIAGFGDVKSGKQIKVANGRYKVTVEKKGYEPQTKEIRVAKNTKEVITLKQKVAAKYPLSIVTTPNNASVQILNIKPKYVAGIMLNEGLYEVKVSASGYESQTRSIYLKESDTTFDFLLKKIEKKPSSVYITTRPSNAEVTAIASNGTQKVITPGDTLDSGSYTLKITAKGYETQNINANVKNGQDFTKLVRLKRDEKSNQDTALNQESKFNANKLLDMSVSKKEEAGDATPIVRIEPKYPIQAARDGVQGWVQMSFTINEVGGVEDVKIINASPERIFDREAKRALRKWKYKPKVVNGKAVKQTGLTVQLDFRLMLDEPAPIESTPPLGKVVEINNDWNFVVFNLESQMRISEGQKGFIEIAGQKHPITFGRISGNQVSITLARNLISQVKVGNRVYAF